MELCHCFVCTLKIDEGKSCFFIQVLAEMTLLFLEQAESAFERESWVSAINRRAGAMRRSKVKTVESTASQACLALR